MFHGVNTMKALSLLVLLVLAACSSSKGDTKKKQAALYFSSGTQSMMAQEYTAALTSLLKANELEPDNTDILNNLGMAYYFKGERDIAVKTINRAIKLNGNNSDAKNNLASIHYHDKNYAQAEKLYIEVSKDLIYDKQARTFYNLGLLELEAKRNPKRAEEYFKKSVKEDDNYCPSYYQLGMIYYNNRQLNLALKNLKEAGTGVCYESPAPHYYQGVVMMELGRLDEARMKFDEVESRFKKTSFATRARVKARELSSVDIGETKQPETAAKSEYLDGPKF